MPSEPNNCANTYIQLPAVDTTAAAAPGPVLRDVTTSTNNNNVLTSITVLLLQLPLPL